MSGYSQDRAGVVSRAVLQIVTRELRAWADGEPDADIAAVCPEIEVDFAQRIPRNCASSARRDRGHRRLA